VEPPEPVPPDKVVCDPPLRDDVPINWVAMC
jgi:hypothetical protein